MSNQKTRKYWIKETRLPGGFIKTTVYREASLWNEKANNEPFAQWEKSYLTNEELNWFYGVELDYELSVDEVIKLLRNHNGKQRSQD